MPSGEKFSCVFCQYQSKSRSIMSFHFRKSHSECQKCQKKFKDASTLTDHVCIAPNLSTTKLPCQFCSVKSLMTETQWRSHLVTNHDYCSICQLTFFGQLEALEHFANEHADVHMEARCPKCDFSAPTPASLIRHFSDSHPSNKAEMDPECQPLSARKRKRTRSKKKEAANEVFLKCSECGFRSQKASTFAGHTCTSEESMKIAIINSFELNDNNDTTLLFEDDKMPAKRTTGDDTLIKCLICEHEASREKLALHMEQVHLQKKPFNCPDACGFQTLDEREFSQHVCYEVHDMDLFSTSEDEMVNKKPSDFHQVKQKMKRRSKEKALLHKCQYCDFSTDTTLKLDSHKKDTHVIKCDKCDFVTHSNSLLQIHGKIHREPTGKKSKLPIFSMAEKLTCDNCDFTTAESVELAKHARAEHLSEKRYQCDRCDFTSFHKHSLMSHIEANICTSSKSSQVLSCELCNFASPSPFSIIDHLMQYHVSKGESETESSKKKKK